MDGTKEIAFIIDQVTGGLTIEGLSATELEALAGDLLSTPLSVNCARPLDPPALMLPAAEPNDGETVRLLRIYHGSVCDGPGRRSVIQVIGCSVKCNSCHVPETHNPAAGRTVRITDAVEEVLSNEGGPRDGVTITGGEPFDQPVALAGMLRQLKARNIHTIVYSGFTVETLRARTEPEVHEALRLADTLIDGPFIVTLSRGATGWRGSTNQRSIDHPATTDTRP
jgi:anaerobic ribonucleoside-triphosphate reductase activating protein